MILIDSPPVTVVADALARYHRSKNEPTYFLTGTDEHGQKIERLAEKEGVTPQALCDRVVGDFKRTWERAQVSHDRFIRTTDEDHLRSVEQMWRRMERNGDLYLADYDALYCTGCEAWKTEEDLVSINNKKLCALHQTPVERIKEQNYFFRLSRYADALLELYRRPDFLRPTSRCNEVTEFVKLGLRDLSVSRMKVKWGIPVPGDPKQSVYVWIDALTNYLTALGGPEEVAAGGRAASLWANSTHLIAKDILRFHAVYWPAMLMSAGLPPPRAIFCHGYLTLKGRKISKSQPATQVNPNAIADAIGMDPLRYFLLREYTFGSDGDFSYEALLQRHESDLGNDLGNLVNRTVTMARQLGPRLEAAGPTYNAYDPLSEETLDLRREVIEASEQAARAWDEMSPSRALEATWSVIRRGNVFLDRTAPWNLKKSGETSALRTVLVNACEVIRRASMMVAPVMPQAARELLQQIGRQEDYGLWPDSAWNGWPGGTLAEPNPVFPRVTPEQQTALLAKWIGPGDTGDEGSKEAVSATPESEEITLDQFARIDLRTARVVAAEVVPKSTRLLRLTLDVGGEPRTVVSGIAEAYAPETLVGRTVIYLANLKPAKIRGVMSQGMILAASDAGALALGTVDKDVHPGSKIR
jgi:methionyl-tRNA synthetase